MQQQIRRRGRIRGRVEDEHLAAGGDIIAQGGAELPADRQMRIHEYEQVPGEHVIPLPAGREPAEPQDPPLENPEAVRLAPDEAAGGKQRIAYGAVDDDVGVGTHRLNRRVRLLVRRSDGHDREAPAEQDCPEQHQPGHGVLSPEHQCTGQKQYAEDEQRWTRVQASIAMVQPLQHAEHQFGLARLEGREVREDGGIRERRDPAGAPSRGPKLNEGAVAGLRAVFDLRIEVARVIVGG